MINYLKRTLVKIGSEAGASTGAGPGALGPALKGRSFTMHRGHNDSAARIKHRGEIKQEKVSHLSNRLAKALVKVFKIVKAG